MNALGGIDKFVWILAYEHVAFQQAIHHLLEQFGIRFIVGTHRQRGEARNRNRHCEQASGENSHDRLDLQN